MKKRCENLVIAMTWSLALGLAPSTGLGQEESESEAVDDPEFGFPRERRDPELKQVMPGIRFGAKLEASAYRERFEGETDKDAALEGVDVELEVDLSEHLSGQFEIAYEFDDSRRIPVEEAFLSWNSGSSSGFYAEIGRMELPFGEYNSSFIEDPGTVAIGESFDDALLAGFEFDAIEISVAGFRGEFQSRNLVGSLVYGGVENLKMGLFATNNIGESVELKEFRREALSEEGDEGEEEEEKFAGFDRKIPGYGFFIAWTVEPFIVDFELIGASESFAAGVIDEEISKPRAWNLELAYQPVPRWQLAGRLERSKELSEYPTLQYGMAFSYGISEHAVITANYLRAEFRDSTEWRNLFQVELTFEY